MNTPLKFPIQAERGAKPHPLFIPWSIAELAYSGYAARYGRTYQSLEMIADRGGFGPSEMDMFLPDWRTRCDENEKLKRLVIVSEKALEIASKHLLNSHKEFNALNDNGIYGNDRPYIIDQTKEGFEVVQNALKLIKSME